MKKPIMALIAIALFISVASATWISDSSRDFGLYEVSSGHLSQSPTMGFNVTGDSKWTLISGENNGQFTGWYWNGTQWIIDSSIIAGLGDLGSLSTPNLVYNLKNDGKWVLISGNYSYGVGSFAGFYWDTGSSQWVSDQSIVSGIGNIGPFTRPSIGFNVTGDGKFTLIAGDNWNINGFYWNGVQWVSDNSLVFDTSPFTTSGYTGVQYAKPTLGFNIGLEDKWTLLISSTYGYTWNGAQWIRDDIKSDGLSSTYTIDGGVTMAFNVTGDEKFTLIAGAWNGELVGFYWNSPPVISTVAMTPDPAYTNASITCVGSYFDSEGDLESGSTFRWFNASEVIPGQVSAVLQNTSFATDDVITCEYTPCDVYGCGIPMNSSSLTIQTTGGFTPILKIAKPGIIKKSLTPPVIIPVMPNIKQIKKVPEPPKIVSVPPKKVSNGVFKPKMSSFIKSGSKKTSKNIAISSKMSSLFSLIGGRGRK